MNSFSRRRMEWRTELVLLGCRTGRMDEADAGSALSLSSQRICICMPAYRLRVWVGEVLRDDRANTFYHILSLEFCPWEMRTPGRATTHTRIFPVSGELYGWSLQLMVPFVKLSLTHLPEHEIYSCASSIFTSSQRYANL